MTLTEMSPAIVPPEENDTIKLESNYSKDSHPCDLEHTWPQGYEIKLFSMLNATEYEISTARKN